MTRSSRIVGARVAVAGGQSHVIPAGVFQPSGIAPWNMAGDLWRSMLREYSEEMLGQSRARRQ